MRGAAGAFIGVHQLHPVWMGTMRMREAGPRASGAAGQMTLGKGLAELDVPLSGLVSFERVTAASGAARN